MFKIIRRLLPGNSKGNNRLRGDATQDALTPDSAPSVTKYRTASCQSRGRERSHNEDTLFVLNSFLAGMDAPVAFGIFLVADGMGGHQSGEIASNLAAQGISQYLLDQIFEGFLFERKTLSTTDVKQCASKAVKEAQSLVLRRVPGGGTTLTLAVILGEEIITAHVGDSRLYLVGPDGALVLKTRDHSLVKRLVDLGEITEDEAELHPHRNVLYRALGQSDPFEPDIDKFSLQPGERLMICSDGLWGVLDLSAMEQIIRSANTMDDAVRELVRMANEAGGPDNISVILVERVV